MLRTLGAALLAVTLTRAAYADPHGQLRAAAPCPSAVSTGASMRCDLLPPTPWRTESYFESHAARVERDLLTFQKGYTLEQMRERDAFLLYGSPVGGASATLGGVGIFSAIVVSAAHAPTPLRALFDHRLHVGPALFDGGGMGAGFGGRL